MNAFKGMLCLLLLASFVFSPTNTHAATYTIMFEEGARTYNPSAKSDYIENKYLARVTVSVDGKTLVTVRGSTIPDSFFFHGGWYEQGNVNSPIDAAIRGIEDDLLKKVDGREPGGNPGSYQQFKDIVDTILAAVPVVQSGTYRFIMGRHQEGRCYSDHPLDVSHSPIPIPGSIQGKYKCHGVPYVPRLLGTNYPSERAYDSMTDHWSRAGTGGYVTSINRNKEHDFARVATGINIHDGRRSLDIRDSEGCLTIHPDDWETFYKALPAPNEWYLKEHRGIVEVKRLRSNLTPAPMPKAPMDFRFVP